MPDFQIVNLNITLARKIFKKPIVCDISPNIAVQVVTLQGVNEQEIQDSLRAITSWDMTNAISAKTLEGGTKK